MKAIRGMQRGVKLAPKPTKAEHVHEIATKVENMQMAGRMTQMMVQQLMQNMQNLAKDLGKALGTLNEMQYKILAMQSVGNFDMDAMAKKAEEMRLNDFIEASDAEDKAGNFTIGEVVTDESTVIITSTAAGDNAGIFRSRIKLTDSGVPALITGLLGKPVGTKVVCKLNGADHEVELLAIRNPPPAVPVDPPDGKNVPVGGPVVNADGSESQDYIRVPETVN